jgi:predicted dehydrogenase
MTVPGEGYKPVPLLKEGYKGVEFARGVADLADAILEKRAHRCNAGMAAHVVEVVEAIHKSARTEKPVAVKSSFVQPAKMPWA